MLRLPRFAGTAQLREVVPVDPDRIGARDRGAPLEADGAFRAVDFGAQLVLAVMQEALEPFLRLETDHVVIEQRAHESLVIGQRDEQPRRWPGNVQEETDAVLEPARAQPLAQWDEMVIVDPDGIVGLDQRRNLVGKAFVDALVALARLAFVLREVEAVMEQRPQRRIGIAVVIFVDIALRQIDRRGGHAVIGLRVDMPGAPAFAFLPRPAEPQPLAIAERRMQRAGKAALRARCAARLGHCNAVGDDDESGLIGQRTSLHGLLSRPAQLMIPTSE